MPSVIFLAIGRRVVVDCSALHTFFIVECGIARFLCVMRVFEVVASSSPPIGYLCAKFGFCGEVTSVAELAHSEKSASRIAYSITHPAYWMRREPKLSLRNTHIHPSSIISTRGQSFCRQVLSDTLQRSCCPLKSGSMRRHLCRCRHCLADDRLVCCLVAQVV